MAGTGEPVMEAEGLAIARGPRTLASGIDFKLASGDRLAITGPSGFGKTTLLDTLAGLIPPSKGTIARRGKALRPCAVQKLYQDPPAAFPPKVALADTFGDLERRHKLPTERLRGLTERLGLAPELLLRPPASVSGGELQRLALARVLAIEPAVVLADEPTSRLDPVTQRQVMSVIADAASDSQAAVILVTHSATMARKWAGRVLDLASFGGVA